MTSSTRIDPDGIRTSIYDIETLYPFGRLFVYHHPRRRVYALPDAASARHYFTAISPAHGTACPPGIAGHGAAAW